MDETTRPASDYIPDALSAQAAVSQPQDLLKKDWPGIILPRFILADDLDSIQNVLSHFPDLLNKRFPEGNWLDHAAVSSTARVVRFFAEKGLKPDQPSKLNKPTLWQAMDGNKTPDSLAVIDALLEMGVSPNVQFERRYPLHFAILSYRDPVGLIDVLARHGADLNVVSLDGQTPLSLAARWGHPKNIMQLLELGADPFLDARDARNAAEQAITNGRRDLADAIQAFTDARKARHVIDAMGSRSVDADAMKGLKSLG